MSNSINDEKEYSKDYLTSSQIPSNSMKFQSNNGNNYNDESHAKPIQVKRISYISSSQDNDMTNNIITNNSFLKDC